MPASVLMCCWGFTLGFRLTMKCQAVESVMSGAGWFSSQNREVVSGSSWEEELDFYISASCHCNFWIQVWSVMVLSGSHCLIFE